MLDMVVLELKAGKGGDGMVGWRREKFEPAGGPYGGDGGKGASIILKADSNMRTLIDFKHKRIFKADNGENGKNKLQYGKDGEDMILKVPVGTLVKEFNSKGLIMDLKNDGDEVIIAKGGRGGRGNAKFKNSVRQAPTFAEPGKKGEEIKVILELKLIADVGFIGYPNVGKSSLLSVISRAKPKIANYHFTTLEPNLGVVTTKDNNSFVAADIPGLIEGAHEGLGLGHSFLKHIERTNVLAHVVDASRSERENPIEDFKKINEELFSYNEKLKDKKQLVVLNKADLVYEKEELEKLQNEFKQMGYDSVITSSATLEGVEMLKYKLYDIIKDMPRNANETFDDNVYIKEDTDIPVHVYKSNGIYFVEGTKVENVLAGVYADNIDSLRYFQRFLEKEGIMDELRELGLKDSDTVDVCGFEFDYYS